MGQVVGLRGDQAPPVTVPGIDKQVIVVTGSVTGSESWTSNYYYVLRGAVFVENGAHAEHLRPVRASLARPAASARSSSSVAGASTRSARARRRSSSRAISRSAPASRGDWGGIIINGRAPVNIEGGEGVGEADTGVYGGNDPNDNSGTMRYVRVEFAGVEFSPDNELNGIAFQGVGRGGTFEFIQVHMNRDDAFEWFGGTADVKYLVASNAADDSFDWTFGWSGRAQFLVVTQRGDDADNGIEADNNEFNNNLLPRSNPADLQHHSLRRPRHS